VQRLNDKLDALRIAAGQGDLRLVAEIAHWIKGAGGTAGFDAFTQPAGCLERLARQGAGAQIDGPIGELEALVRRIQLPVGK
jgi:HPt (histidine-containing phosphotransfer) domain-containing protein